jgi:hypothetical protein
MLIYGEAGEARQAWQSDPDAWMRGADPFANVEEAKVRRPGLWARLRQRLKHGRPLPPDFDQQVDRVLERLHKVGMVGLSGRERKILHRASRRRGTG